MVHPTVISIYIKSDGSIEPADSPIINVGNNEYLLTENLSAVTDSLSNGIMYNIVIEKDNIVFDGANHAIAGSGSQGIEIFYRNNVTIQNIVLSGFDAGINVFESSKVNITHAFILDSDFGTLLTNSSSVVVAETKFADNSNNSAISMTSCTSSIIYNNIMSGTSMDGIALSLQFCSNNSIVANTMTNFSAGINFVNSSNNYFFENNMLGNKIQAQDLLTTESYQKINDINWQLNEGIPPEYQNYILQFSTDTWNNNYWSDYNSNGAYVIDQNNVDHHPLTQQVNISAPVPSPTISDLISFLPIHIIAVIVVLMVIVVSLLFFRRHRKTTNP